MLRSKLGLLGLCALALGLMAFVTSSASAAEWLILESNKTTVNTAAKLPASIVGEFEEKTDGTLLTHLVGIELNILCTAFTLTGTKLEGGGLLTNGGTVTFTGCTVPTSADCKVNSPGQAVGTIVSKAVKGTLQTNGEVLIEPKTGTVLIELVLSGELCLFSNLGTQTINGVLWIVDAKAKTHEVKHLISESKAKFSGKQGTLWIGKDTAEHLETSIDGSAWAFLTGATHSGLAFAAE